MLFTIISRLFHVVVFSAKRTSKLAQATWMGPALHYFVKTDPGPLVICHIRSQNFLDSGRSKCSAAQLHSCIGGMYIHRQLAYSSNQECYTLGMSIPSLYVDTRLACIYMSVSVDT